MPRGAADGQAGHRAPVLISGAEVGAAFIATIQACKGLLLIEMSWRMYGDYPGFGLDARSERSAAPAAHAQQLCSKTGSRERAPSGRSTPLGPGSRDHVKTRVAVGDHGAGLMPELAGGRLRPGQEVREANPAALTDLLALVDATGTAGAATIRLTQAAGVARDYLRLVRATTPEQVGDDLAADHRRYGISHAGSCSAPDDIWNKSGE